MVFPTFSGRQEKEVTQTSDEEGILQIIGDSSLSTIFLSISHTFNHSIWTQGIQEKKKESSPPRRNSPAPVTGTLLPHQPVPVVASVEANNTPLLYSSLSGDPYYSQIKHSPMSTHQDPSILKNVTPHPFYAILF